MDFAILTLLEEAIRHQFSREANKFVQLGGGFSGTPIFQFSLESQLWVARAWLCSAESRNKIDNWSEVSIHLERRVAELKPWFQFSPIPRPIPWKASIANGPLTLQIGNHLWTLARWAPGEPLKSGDVTSELLLGYVTQLAGLHRLTREMQHNRTLSSGLRERRNLLVEIPSDLMEIASLCSNHPLRDELAQFIIKCNERSRTWLPTIDRLAKRVCECHWIIRDLWRDNLLVDSDKRWIHTVDVGASRSDWPAFDFVRLVGSLLPPSYNDGAIGFWQNLLDAYNKTNPHSDLPPATDLQAIHDVSTAISIIYWAKRSSEHNIAPELLASRTNRMRELLVNFLGS